MLTPMLDSYFISFRRTSKINNHDTSGKPVLEKWDLLTPPSHVVNQPPPNERRPAET